MARQLKQLMPEQGLPNYELAARMRTNRTALERLLDPNKVTLNTLQNAGRTVGREFRLKLVSK